jgi:hypothetical protein
MIPTRRATTPRTKNKYFTAKTLRFYLNTTVCLQLTNIKLHYVTLQSIMLHWHRTQTRHVTAVQHSGTHARLWLFPTIMEVCSTHLQSIQRPNLGNTDRAGNSPSPTKRYNTATWFVCFLQCYQHTRRNIGLHLFLFDGTPELIHQPLLRLRLTIP